MLFIVGLNLPDLGIHDPAGCFIQMGCRLGAVINDIRGTYHTSIVCVFYGSDHILAILQLHRIVIPDLLLCLPECHSLRKDYRGLC